MKTCIKCNENKPKTDFYKHNTGKDKLSSKCKVCEREYQREKYPQFKEKQRKRKKEWYLNNIEHCREYTRNYTRERYNNDEEFKLLALLRSRMSRYLSSNNVETRVEFLGCSPKEWKLYLEQQFKDNMSWDNHGIHWEIDHIIPLSKGGSFHYTNTQPLTITENRSKGAKI